MTFPPKSFQFVIFVQDCDINHFIISKLFILLQENLILYTTWAAWWIVQPATPCLPQSRTSSWKGDDAGCGWLLRCPARQNEERSAASAGTDAEPSSHPLRFGCLTDATERVFCASSGRSLRSACRTRQGASGQGLDDTRTSRTSD